VLLILLAVTLAVGRGVAEHLRHTYGVKLRDTNTVQLLGGDDALPPGKKAALAGSIARQLGGALPWLLPFSYLCSTSIATQAFNAFDPDPNPDTNPNPNPKPKPTRTPDPNVNPNPEANSKAKPNPSPTPTPQAFNAFDCTAFETDEVRVRVRVRVRVTLNLTLALPLTVTLTLT